MDVRYENEGYISFTMKWYVLDAPDECTKLVGWDGGRGYLLTATVWPADHDYTENKQHTVFVLNSQSPNPDLEMSRNPLALFTVAFLTIAPGKH